MSKSLFDGVNHVAILTSDMDRFIRFYQDAFDAEVVFDNPNHGKREGERMVVMTLGGPSALNVFQVPGNTQAEVQTPCSAVAASITWDSMLEAAKRWT